MGHVGCCSRGDGAYRISVRYIGDTPFDRVGGRQQSITLGASVLILTTVCRFSAVSPRDNCSNSRRPKEWKEHARHLVAILATEEGAPDGQMLVPLDTDICRRMLDVKAVALRVLELVATDHERVVEVGRCGGFQVRVV